jgi:hypothetical protein
VFLPYHNSQQERFCRITTASKSYALLLYHNSQQKTLDL